MARSLTYRLYISVLCLLSVISVKAQYSETDLLKEADAFFEQGQYAAAMPLYSQLLSLNPTKPEFNYKYGATALYGDSDKKEEAIKFLRYASTKNGIDAKCWYFLGRAYHLNYQFADAINAYNKYKVLEGDKASQELQVDREIEDCRNGQNLLSNIKDVKVLDKKQSPADAFFRIYDLTDIGGKILVTPEVLLSSLDKKRNHQSLIHFRGTGTTVYFSSYGKDGKNGLDIYSAEVLPDGSFSEPKELGPTINSPFDEDFPFLHSDNKTFYFSSKGHSSMGGYDIFLSQYVSGAFSTPKNLDFAINTPDDDLFYIADSAKKMANFASARSSKQGELHVYKVLVSSVPADITFVKGNFINQISRDNKLAKITVVDASTNKEIDVQYTDPQTGDYVLSFPRSGKYKFSVEAEKSDRVHAGVVEIPKSSGINAYLQEMELISSAGVEKLLINNLFDQKYDGDVAALAQQLLRQKAALDVNFNAEEVPEVDPEVVETKDNVALAYNAAGFGAGLSNEKVLELAKKREDDFKSQKAKVTNLKLAAEEHYFESIAIANTKAAEADALIAKSASGDEYTKGELMFKAGMAKMQAENAIREAANTKTLIDDLANLELKAGEAVEKANSDYIRLESALESGDYNTALEALKAENTIQAGVDRTNSDYDAMDKVQLASIESRNEAQKYLDRASSMRGQTEEAEARLLTKKRQAEKAKGKDAKALDAEVERLSVDVEDLRSSAARAFDQAENVQKESFDKKQQFEILTELYDKVAIPEYKAPQPREITDDDAATFAALEENVADLSVDPEMVSNYLQKNPGATDSFGSDQTALAFKREYASAESDDLAFSEDVTESTSNSKTDVEDNTDLVDTENSTRTDNVATQETGESNPTTLQGDGEQEPDFSDNADDLLADEEPLFEGSDEEITEPELAGLNAQSEEDVNETKASSGVESESIETNDETERLAEAEQNENTEELAEAATDETLSEANTIETLAEAEPRKTNTSDTAPTNNKTDQSTSLNVSVENQIAAEQVRITASEDWIAIIEASISDLEQGVGGDESEDVEEQLKQYQALKITKEKEIAASKAKILALSEEESAEKPELAMDRTENDLDTLSASLISRLESKIPDASTDSKYIVRINEVNQDYLSELASIELSGLSDPEIAAMRIELNTEFNQALDQLIEGQAVSEISKEDLIELRRIKGLEIRQDRLIQTGEMAYQPRTPGAQEYAALMTEPNNENDSDKNVQQPDLSGLSPEFASALQAPYTRNTVVADYDSQLEKIESETDENKVFAERLKLNKQYFNNLQAEIQMYSAALKSEENPQNVEIIQERYQTLLSERSAIVDEIADDQERADSSTASEIALAEAEIAKETEAEEADDEEPLEIFIAPEEDDANESIENRDYFVEYEANFVSEMEEINAEGLSEANKLKKLSALNAKYATRLDSVVAELISQLDNPASNVNRDDAQLQIQNLDAIAADMRQESDRLNTEAELTLLADSEPVEKSEETSDQIETSPETDSSAENTTIEPVNIASIEADWEPIDQINELKYKSLNANISLNRIKPMVESVNSKKDEARALVTKINDQSDKQLRADLLEDLEVLNDEIAQIENELNIELKESNAAEIAFYQNSNEVMIKGLSEIDAKGEEKINLDSLKEQVSILNSNYAQVEISFAENEISSGERAAAEMELITKLSEINEELEAETEKLEPEIAATDFTSPTESADRNVEPLLKAMIDNSENYTPEPGMVYITPIHRFFEAEMNEEEKTKLQDMDDRLEIDYDFVLNNSAEDDTELLQAETEIDEMGMDLLKSNPNQFQYLLASLRADSLKRLEIKQSAYVSQMDQESFEKLTEVKRLEGMVVHEDNDQIKKQLQERADRIAAEATVNYKKSAIAAFQSEKLRNLRKEQEAEVAFISSKLSALEVAEVNQVLGKSYTVVPSDLASAEENPSKKVQRANTKTNLESKDQAIDTATDSDLELEKETVEPELVSTQESEETPTPVVTIPETTTPPKFEELSLNEDLSSIDEKLLLEAHGNWLNVYEVIGQKDDFSDVKESLFVKSEASVYNESTPIPINPPLPGGLIFQVQVGAFRNSIPQDLFGEFAPVMGQELPNGITRYRAGVFKAYKSAITARNQIRAKGYSDAFVVAYVDGERLTGTQAQQILEQTRVSEGLTVEETMDPAPRRDATAIASNEGNVSKPINTTAPTDYYNDPEAAEANLVEATTGLFYTVQVGVYSKPVKLDALYNLIELNSELTASGYIRYTSGRYTSPETAGLRKAEAIEKGVADAFITAYYNGKRISVAKAQSIFEQEGVSVLSSEIGKSPKAPKQSDADKPEDDTKYVVILGSYAGDIPQSIANVFLERSDLQIRRVTAPNGVSIYASPEFETKAEAEDFLKLSKAAGVDSALMGKVVNGKISSVETK